MNIKTKDLVLFITKILFFWIIIIYCALAIMQTSIVSTLSFNSIIFNLLAILILLMVVFELIKFLFFLIPYIVKEFQMEYIINIKDKKGFKDLTEEEENKFLDLMNTYYNFTLIKSIPIALIGVFILFVGFAIKFLLMEFLGLSIVLIALFYTIPFKYSRDKISKLKQQEKKNLENHNRKYQVLVLGPIQEKLNSNEK